MSYTPEFYSAIESASFKAAQVVVPFLEQLLSPQSVVDIGCGTGSWLKVFKDLGKRVQGVDQDRVPESQLLISSEEFFVHDLRQDFSWFERYDVALSLEVAEHLPPGCASAFVQNLTRLSDVVVFSAAVPFQGGTEHLNEQWPDYWIALFDQQGYIMLDALRPAIWGLKSIPWWYRQNMLLFLKPERLKDFPELQKTLHPTSPRVRSMVHPHFYDALIEKHFAALKYIQHLENELQIEKGDPP